MSDVQAFVWLSVLTARKRTEPEGLFASILGTSNTNPVLANGRVQVFVLVPLHLFVLNGFAPGVLLATESVALPGAKWRT